VLKVKFKVDRNKLQKAIGTVIDATASNNSILTHIMVEARDNALTLTATNLEITMRCRVESDVLEPGVIALPSKKLNLSVREFRGDVIQMESSEDENVAMKDVSGKTRAKVTINGSPAGDFPSIESPEESKYIQFPVDMFMEMMRKTQYAIATEDARYVFNGMYITSENGTTVCVGTDGRRLSRVSREFPGGVSFGDNHIIPLDACKKLQNIFDSGEPGYFAYEKDSESPMNRNTLHFRSGSIDMICKLIDGQYPNYKQVIPDKVSYRVSVNRQNLESAIRQVAVMAAEPTKQVRFKLSKGELGIASQTQDVGDANDSIPCEYDGPEMEIAFNSNYLTDVTRSMSSDNIEIGFSSHSAPMIMIDPEDQGFVAVVMPMKI
jgi:DNA polymerase-3 subunit beta